MSKGYFLIVAFVYLFIFTAPIHAATYYVSPVGNDSNSGTTEAQALRTFSAAMPKLHAGDSLILLDGTYTQTMTPVNAGSSSQWITVKAKNPGKAVIEGEHKRNGINFVDYIANPAYYNIEDLMITNALVGMDISAAYVNVRRVSIYADYYRFTQQIGQYPFLTHGIHIMADNVLVEDSILAGVMAKVLKILKSGNVTIRRTISDWRWFDGQLDLNSWPWSGGFNTYLAYQNTFENVISLGQQADYGINVHGKDTPDYTGRTDSNKYLGSIVIGNGMTFYSESYIFGGFRPQPSFHADVNFVYNPSWPGWGAGFSGGGIFSDTLFQDLLVTGSRGNGFHFVTSAGSSNNRINGLSVYNNGLGGEQTQELVLDSGFTISNSYVEGDSRYTGPGADITKKYLNGVKTSESLWPWPMEQRVRNELGYSITNKVAAVVPTQVQPIDNFLTPIIKVSSTYINFKDPSSGGQSSYNLTLSNPGNGVLQVASLTPVNEEDDPVFSLGNSSTCSKTQPFSLQPGGSCVINLQFYPVRNIQYTGRLIIRPANLGSINLPFIVNLAGQGTSTGTPPPTINPTHSPTPTPLNRPCSLIGDSSCSGSCDNVVNILDYTSLLTRYATNTACVDLNADSSVNILDYTVISQNFGRTLP